MIACSWSGIFQFFQKLLAKLLGVLGKSRIANNINQLAKAANSGSLPVNEEVLQSINDGDMVEMNIVGILISLHHYNSA